MMVPGRAAGSPAVRGQASRWNDDKTGSDTVTPIPLCRLSEAQVQASATEPGPE